MFYSLDIAACEVYSSDCFWDFLNNLLIVLCLLLGRVIMENGTVVL